ncbi:reductive dehalogenase [Desulfobacula phenolica]|uniref:Reductive dehalogenase n=1 Tax=Desulfobacula phenolica TaxID=90732 RepID=A0A1H2K601_9BACT|nr:reductive dehalogenase [Desulfobacula phenolica]SDU63786.1 reductive dehalogenase [Desulfobacula phenolica]
MSDDKKNMENQQEKSVDRRNFLKIGGAAISSMGLAAVGGTAAFAINNDKKEEKILSEKLVYRPDGWQGAKVRYLDYPGGSFDINNPKQVDISSGYLGTTKIAGKIKRVSEMAGGFHKYNAGFYGDPKKLVKATGKKHVSPIGDAIRFATFPYGSEKIIDGKPNPKKFPIPGPEEMSRHMKDLGFFLGAADVGIGVMPTFALFSHNGPSLGQLSKGIRFEKPVENSHPLAITLLFDQGFKAGTMGSNGYDGGTFGSRRAYLMGAVAAVTIAKYIRNLGYSARAHNVMNYQLTVPPVAIASGMGELCRVGDCVLHPYLGFRHKDVVVTTDMPLMPDRPIDFGVQDFCRVCKKCAEECPSGAITKDDDKVLYNGYYKWKLDYDKCTLFRRTNPEGYGCGRCLKVCPWASKEDSWYHRLGSYLGSLKSDSTNRVIREMDDICGYGTEFASEYKWWLGYMDGTDYRMY